MATQGSLLRIFNSVVCYRNVLYNSSRTTISGHQQFIGLKQDFRTKIQDLKIPDKPKKPLTPYFRFMTDRRQNVQKQFPDMKLTQLTKQLSEDWAACNDSVKEKYSIDYKTDMESYNVLFDAYTKKLTPDQKDALQMLSQEKSKDKKRRLVRKQNKEAAKPKRPIGPYMQYLLATAKREGLKMNEVLVSMKGKWGMLSDSEKEKYNELYQQDKKRYELEMKVWEAKMINEGKSELIRSSSQKLSKPTRLRPTKKE